MAEEGTTAGLVDPGTPSPTRTAATAPKKAGAPSATPTATPAKRAPARQAAPAKTNDTGGTGGLDLGSAGPSGNVWDQGEVDESTYEAMPVALVGPNGDELGLAQFFPEAAKKPQPYAYYTAQVAKMSVDQRQALANVLVSAGITAAKTTPFTAGEVTTALGDALQDTLKDADAKGQAPTLTGYLATQTTQQTSATQGAASADVNDLVSTLQSVADDYQLPASAPTLTKMAQQYLDAGLTETEAEANYKQAAQQQAAGLYPEFAPQILAGIDTKTLLEPYASLAEKTLGLDPTTINWQAPTFAAALDGGADPSTGRSTVATLSQFSQNLMSNPAFGYQNTQEAQNSAGSLTASLLKLFGKLPDQTLSTSISGPTPDLSAT